MTRAEQAPDLSRTRAGLLEAQDLNDVGSIGLTVPELRTMRRS